MSDDDLIDQLRRAASIWFKNSDLLLLEDFIRRFNRLRKPPMSILNKLLKDLEWRGPNGSMLGHIVLTREETQTLLYNVRVKLTPEQAANPSRPMGISETPPITEKDIK